MKGLCYSQEFSNILFVSLGLYRAVFGVFFLGGLGPEALLHGSGFKLECFVVVFFINLVIKYIIWFFVTCVGDLNPQGRLLYRFSYHVFLCSVLFPTLLKVHDLLILCDNRYRLPFFFQKMLFVLNVK